MRDTTPSGIRVTGVTDTAIIDRGEAEQATVVFSLTNTNSLPVLLEFRDACQVHPSILNERGQEIAQDVRHLCGDPSYLTLVAGETNLVMVVHFASQRFDAPDLPAGRYRITVWLNLRDELPYRVAATPVVITVTD